MLVYIPPFSMLNEHLHTTQSASKGFFPHLINIQFRKFIMKFTVAFWHFGVQIYTDVRDNIIDIQQECQDNSTGKEESVQEMVLRQLDSHMQKHEVGPLPHTKYKN